MIRFSRTALVAVVTASALALGACSSTESASEATSSTAAEASEATTSAAEASESADGTVTVTDNYGEKTVPVPPKRVVALDLSLIHI